MVRLGKPAKFSVDERGAQEGLVRCLTCMYSLKSDFQKVCNSKMFVILTFIYLFI
jgi:hypothetical protein